MQQENPVQRPQGGKKIFGPLEGGDKASVSVEGDETGKEEARQVFRFVSLLPDLLYAD